MVASQCVECGHSATHGPLAIGLIALGSAVGYALCGAMQDLGGVHAQAATAIGMICRSNTVSPTASAAHISPLTPCSGPGFAFLPIAASFPP